MDPDNHCRFHHLEAPWQKPPADPREYRPPDKTRRHRIPCRSRYAAMLYFDYPWESKPWQKKLGITSVPPSMRIQVGIVAKSSVSPCHLVGNTESSAVLRATPGFVLLLRAVFDRMPAIQIGWRYERGGYTILYQRKKKSIILSFPPPFFFIPHIIYLPSLS